MTEAGEVVAFWQEAGRTAWFKKDAAFDDAIRQRFAETVEQAAAGALDHWIATPEGALALMVLLDQFPRNLFRGQARAFASDERARGLAAQALALGHDTSFAGDLRAFFYLPFEHSEDMADQDRSVALFAALGDAEFLKYAEVHRDIIRDFGRFPHRNPLLGRTSSADELAFLAEGGFAGWSRAGWPTARDIRRRSARARPPVAKPW